MDQQVFVVALVSSLGILTAGLVAPLGGAGGGGDGGAAAPGDRAGVWAGGGATPAASVPVVGAGGDATPAGGVPVVGGEPVRVDADADGLADGREAAADTDPTEPDTDGDGLPDGAEVRGETPEGVSLPGASPLHKDVYLVIVYGAGTSLEPKRLAEPFYRARVANPDGTTGIRVHVETVHLDERVPFNGTVARFAELRATYQAAILGDRVGTHRLLLVVDRPGFGKPRGYADSPGTLAVVRSDDRPAAVHELAHTLVGDLPADACPDADYEGHVCAGDDAILSPSPPRLGELRFSPITRRHLNKTGIDPS